MNTVPTCSIDLIGLRVIIFRCKLLPCTLQCDVSKYQSKCSVYDVQTMYSDKICPELIKRAPFQNQVVNRGVVKICLNNFNK